MIFAGFADRGRRPARRGLEPEEKLRADARLNRDRILDVTREALATHPGASLNAIAEAAGRGRRRCIAIPSRDFAE